MGTGFLAALAPNEFAGQFEDSIDVIIVDMADH